MLGDGLHDVPAGKLAVVVTHLEMTAAPAPTDVALPEGVQFRQVTPDVAWYRDIFDRVGRDWLWYGRRKVDDAALAEIILHPEVAIYTLSKGGRDEALLELNFREPAECELAYFGLTSALIGSGAGRYLMSRAIAAAFKRPIQRLHLHTCTMDSPQALSFYIRSGFTPTRKQIQIDDDPRAVGLMPQDLAPHVPLIL